MSNDGIIREFFDTWEGTYYRRQNLERTWCNALSSASGKDLREVFAAINADPKVTKLPPLPVVQRALPDAESVARVQVPENPDCPRGCSRGIVVAQDRDGYDFVTACDCPSGRAARDTAVVRTMCTGYTDTNVPRYEKLPSSMDVQDHEARGCGPGDAPPPMSPEGRVWLENRSKEVGRLQAMHEAVKARMRRLGLPAPLSMPSIASTRTEAERRAAEAHTRRVLESQE